MRYQNSLPDEAAQSPPHTRQSFTGEARRLLSFTLILLGALAMLACLTACGGETTPPQGAMATPAAPLPTAEEPSTALSTATAIPPSPTPVPPRPTSPSSEPTDTPATPTSAPTKPDNGNSSPAEEVAAIRLIVKEYWEALNDYDVDRALPMLEESYRAAEEELIRKDIRRMKLFRVKLGVSEETPPTLNGNADYETYLSLETPIDTRRVLMVFRRIGGEWWIVHSDEVE